MKPSEIKAAWLKAHLKKGELYSGIILGKNGAQDHHVILLPGDSEGITWAKAKEFAKKAGGELPTRVEQSLLFANLKDSFKPTWYWSDEPAASDASFAWFQNFGDGTQLDDHIDHQCPARAVRRLIIE